MWEGQRKTYFLNIFSFLFCSQHINNSKKIKKSMVDSLLKTPMTRCEFTVKL